MLLTFVGNFLIFFLVLAVAVLPSLPEVGNQILLKFVT